MGAGTVASVVVEHEGRQRVAQRLLAGAGELDRDLAGLEEIKAAVAAASAKPA